MDPAMYTNTRAPRLRRHSHHILINRGLITFSSTRFSSHSHQQESHHILINTGLITFSSTGGLIPFSSTGTFSSTRWGATPRHGTLVVWRGVRHDQCSLGAHATEIDPWTTGFCVPQCAQLSTQRVDEAQTWAVHRSLSTHQAVIQRSLTSDARAGAEQGQEHTQGRTQHTCQSRRRRISTHAQTGVMKTRLASGDELLFMEGRRRWRVRR